MAVDMVMDAVMDPVIELEESVSVVYVFVELITLVLTGMTVLLVSRDSGTVATEVEVPTTLVMGTRFEERLLSSVVAAETTLLSVS